MVTFVHGMKRLKVGFSRTQRPLSKYFNIKRSLFLTNQKVKIEIDSPNFFVTLQGVGNPIIPR